MFGAVYPLLDVGDVRIPAPQIGRRKVALLAGDLALAGFEDALAEAWPKMLGDQNLERSFKITAAFWRVMQAMGTSHDASLIVCDLGPSLGALNRAALVAADFVVLPMGADLFSLHGLHNLGPTLKRWRKQWSTRRTNFEEHEPLSGLNLPSGAMQPIGYIANRHTVVQRKPVKAFRNWIERIPGVYRESVLGEQDSPPTPIESDPHCLAQLKDYRSLAAMAQDHRKPMFSLTVADGAIGGHQAAVKQCRDDFSALARQILARVNLQAPPGELF